MIAFILRHFLGMPGLSEGMFCELSLFHWLTRFTVFCFAHIFNLILAVQKCLLQLVFLLHGFEPVHRQLAMLRNKLDIVSLCHCLCCTLSVL